MLEKMDYLIQPLSEAVASVFETLAFSEVINFNEIDKLPPWVKTGLCSSIEIENPISAKFSFIIDNKNAESVYESISGDELNEDRDESIKDLVLEITNSIAGAFAVNIQEKGNVIKLGLPIFCKNMEDYSDNCNSENVKNLLFSVENYEIICILEMIECRNELPIDKLDTNEIENEIEKTLKDAKILIVDDSQTQRLSLKKILKEYGCEITEAKDGNEALKMLSNEKPDLILLDVMMPGKDGFSTCEIIKSTPDFSQIPVIFITSMDDKGYKIRGFELGAIDYIPKPYYAEEVLARVKTQLKLVSALKTLREYNVQLENRLDERTKDLIKSEREAVFGQMVQGIVHNIRNPLTGIMGAANLIKSDLNGKINKQKIPKMVKKVEIIERSSRNLNQMICSLMQKSRSDHTEEFEYFNLNELLKQELDFLEADHVFKNKVEKEILFSKTSSRVFAVPSMISQVFQNLIRNALDAMFEKDNPELKIKTYSDNGFISFSVADNGPGISSEIVDKIFDPFFTTKPKKNFENDNGPVGTGLGLYICSEMIKVNNGKIAVNTKENQGTEFNVSLPVTAEEK